MRSPWRRQNIFTQISVSLKQLFLGKEWPLVRFLDDSRLNYLSSIVLRSNARGEQIVSALTSFLFRYVEAPVVFQDSAGSVHGDVCKY